MASASCCSAGDAAKSDDGDEEANDDKSFHSKFRARARDIARGGQVNMAEKSDPAQERWRTVCRRS